MDDLSRILKNAGLKPVLVEEKQVIEEQEQNISEILIVEDDSETYTPEYYSKKLKEFMKVDEAAGVGINAEFNTYPYTPDIKKGTLRKTGKKLGFNITDGGIPPKISKDSVNKD